MDQNGSEMTAMDTLNTTGFVVEPYNPMIQWYQPSAISNIHWRTCDHHGLRDFSLRELAEELTRRLDADTSERESLEKLVKGLKRRLADGA